MSISKRKTKNGVRYYAQVCVKGQRPGKMFDSLSEAKLWEAQTEIALKQGMPPEEETKQGDMLFIEAADRFILESRKTISRGQIQNYEHARDQLVRSFGPVAKLSTITPQDVSAHIMRRISTVGPSIIRKECSLIRLVYSKAKEWGSSFVSPEIEVKRPRQKAKSREEKLHRVLTADELQAILGEAKNRRSNLQNYLVFLLYTGMRPSEAASLYWSRLPTDEEKSAVRSMQPVGYVDLKRGGFSKIGTKTEQRFVPAHPLIVELLHKMPRQEGKRLVFLDDKFIGRHRAYLHFRRSMQTTLSKARLTDGSPLRGDIDFYSFRHTARSAMSVCGISTEAAETIIGHQDFKFTYIHLSDSDLIREIAKLNFGVQL